jgi:enoyl-CoA hydratase
MMYRDYKQLTFERRENSVLLITLNRPEKYNAVDEVMHGELARVWTDISADPETRVAVVTGAGKAFSAGGDLEMVQRMAGNYDRVASMLTEMSDLVYHMINCEKPVVSAINGVAVGAGLVVALLADISICAEDALLGDGHVKLGVAAGDHAALIWPFLMGMAKARYYLLTGEMLSFMGPDVVEGASALREKRPPSFPSATWSAPGVGSESAVESSQGREQDGC